jgi:hypothetical protein
VLREILDERVVSSRTRGNPRGLKRKMRSDPLRPRTRSSTARMTIEYQVRTIK